MSTLVIIGNGFDIWHGLPTTFCDFKEECSDYLIEYISYFDDLHSTDRNWSNFENSLQSFNTTSFIENATLHHPEDAMLGGYGLNSGNADEIYSKAEELVSEIAKSFSMWINSIEMNRAEELIVFPSSYKFINFNYTPTLQYVCGIPDSNILHIHGNKLGNIIFGHGSYQSLETSDEHRPWRDESLGNACIVFERLRKPVYKVLKENRSQLESYGDLKKIIVIGHSIDDIDKPYFDFILKTYPNAEWENYNHEDGVKESHEKLIALGIPENKLESDSTKALEKIYPIS